MADDKFSAQQMVDALMSTKGMITVAARQLGCASNTVRRYLREYPTVAAAQKEARESLGDSVELTLANMALGKTNKAGVYEREPNIAALIFLAKTKFKDRGYVERMEHVIFDVPAALQEELKRELEAAGLDQERIFQELIDAAKARRALVGTNGAGQGERGG